MRILRLLLVGACLIASGCSHRPASVSPKDSLVLRLEGVKVDDDSRTATLAYAIENISDREIEFCFSYWGISVVTHNPETNQMYPLLLKSSTIHQLCAERTELAPGERKAMPTEVGLPSFLVCEGTFDGSATVHAAPNERGGWRRGERWILKLRTGLLGVDMLCSNGSAVGLGTIAAIAERGIAATKHAPLRPGCSASDQRLVCS